MLKVGRHSNDHTALCPSCSLEQERRAYDEPRAAHSPLLLYIAVLQRYVPLAHGARQEGISYDMSLREGRDARGLISNYSPVVPLSSELYTGKHCFVCLIHKRRDDGK